MQHAWYLHEHLRHASESWHMFRVLMHQGRRAKASPRALMRPLKRLAGLWLMLTGPRKMLRRPSRKLTAS